MIESLVVLQVVLLVVEAVLVEASVLAEVLYIKFAQLKMMSMSFIRSSLLCCHPDSSKI